MTITGVLRGATRFLADLHLRRLATAPRVEAGDDLTGGEYVVRGVVCPVCASRTASALRAVPGVEDVRVDLARSRAMVRFSPDAPLDADARVPAMQAALERVVVGMSARRAIERLVRSVGQRRRRSTLPGRST